MSEEKAMRFNTGKLKMALIPPLILIELARVYTSGSYKYADHNWMKGMSWSDVLGCAHRHIVKWQLGESRDPENGCHHLALAAWNLLTLMFFQMEKIQDDDRPKFSMGYDENLIPIDNGGDRIGMNKEEVEEYLEFVRLEKKKNK